MIIVVSVGASQCSLDDSIEDNFQEELFDVASNLGEKEIALVAGDGFESGWRG